VARRLILDTTVRVTAERGAKQLDKLLEDDDDVAIAAITAAELLVGVELAGASRYRARKAFVEDVLGTIPVEEYDLEVARAHAGLLAHVRRSGKPCGAHDLIIAAPRRPPAVPSSRWTFTASRTFPAWPRSDPQASRRRSCQAARATTTVV
jgi:tRNA(fMet)-specific endonuclease VapC